MRQKASLILIAILAMFTTVTSANAIQIPERVIAVDKEAAENCATIDGVARNQDVATRIRAIHDTIKQSETGSWLINFAKDNSMGVVWLCFSDEILHYGMYMSGRGVIKLSSTFTHNELVGVVAHELRHRWQEERGYGSYANKHLSVYSERILEFGSEADAEAIAVSVLWELKEKGIDGPFDAHNSVKLCEERNLNRKMPCYFDISHIYKQIVIHNPTAIKDGSALSQAFRQWFENEIRVNAYEFILSMKQIGQHPRHRAKNKKSGPKPPTFIPPVASPLNKFINEGEMDNLGELPHIGQNYLTQNGGYEKVMVDKKKLLPMK